MQIINESWKGFWDGQEIRILVLASLCLQFGLALLSPWRKRAALKPLIVLLWSFYQAADYVAILALGNILKKQSVQSSATGDLMAFWAPFLLLHLGGPDTITSYSIEDNELSLRHITVWALQSSIAFLVLLGLLAVPRLRVAAAIVFVTGILKYAERALALWSASMDKLRNSMVIKDPDAGQSYAEFMGEYARRRDAGQSGYVKKKDEAPEQQLPSHQQAAGPASQTSNDVKLIVEAYEFFTRFKPIVVDLMLTFLDRNVSQTYFWDTNASQAFKVVEMELSFLCDVFHTKAILIRSIPGFIWRLISLSTISAAFILFCNCDKRGGFTKLDIRISYTLLGSALFMEFTSLLLIATSDWMVVALSRHTWPWLHKLANVIAFGVSCIFPTKGKPRWSNSVSQYNLLSFSLGDKRSWIRWILQRLQVKKFWDDFVFVRSISVPDKLKQLVFEELVEKSKSAGNTAGFKELRDCKGERALQQEQCNHLRWSVDKEFDESLLLWHIATDVCFNIHMSSKKCETSQVSLIMSNYMVYLLSMQPSMMPAGIGKIRFKDTCVEAKDYFRKEKKAFTEAEAREALLDVETEVDPEEVTGDRCKSVLFSACRLAKQLNLLPEDKRWCLISKVWVEMLGYAAIKCRTYNHAKQLTNGGELLTHIWLLMAHMGIGEQYRVEKGRASAKLAINN